MKILVLRFSSIGDIVLTTPVVRALAQQVPNAEVHFATKPGYRGLLEPNPYITKVHCLTGSLGQLVRELHAERFDFVVDLHNNLRTTLLKVRLGVPGSSFDKLNWQKWLLVNFKIDRLPRVHIVQRYLEAAAMLGVKDDGHGLDYFIPEGQEIELNTLPAAFQRGYVAVAIGAQHATKRLPVEKLIELCAKLARPIVLLGGPEDESIGHIIEQAFATKAATVSAPAATIPDSPYRFPEKSLSHSAAQPLIVNGCGRYTLHQSASLLRQAQFVVSHDTGLMHIAAAFGKEIFSVWGNTVPEFGMYPYRTEFKVLEVKGLSCRPCSKIGFDKCPQGHFKCMRDQNLDLDLPPMRDGR
ncbi:glycosyltransferase family 9 protein [Hymenobacter sp. BT770]|uniref:glycosyltransferase family 9 protein n=1 Tax=Hymenobacter sp. BT770 TaxID=2886942 RepID=UPI001D11E1A6|nr:glycosyltransferase family 9 protein [Hymenobacter sp. BT770]MCC3152859.1 glycosyltransferase family 9 protein [Hymenobacter sp. BT770]MDO3414934.1 glycosyltransferase family 9 protein [Hymenobacter sp. BT770]